MLEVVLKVLEVVNGVRCVLWVMFCMLFCVLLYMLEAVEGWHCFCRRCCEVLEVMRRVLCTLEAIGGGLCLLEVS